VGKVNDTPTVPTVSAPSNLSAVAPPRTICSHLPEANVSDTTHATYTAVADSDLATERAVAWLQDEFPGWVIDVDETATWEGDLRSLWIARREGHHPQAELSAAKLHSRLSDYLQREERRRAFSN